MNYNLTMKTNLNNRKILIVIINLKEEWEEVYQYMSILHTTINFMFSLMTILLVPFLLYVRFFTLRLNTSKRSISSVKNSDLNEASSSLENLANKKYDDIKNRNELLSNHRIQLAFFMVLNSFLFVMFYFNFTLYEELSDIMSLNEKYFFNIIVIIAIVLHVYLRSTNPGYIEGNSKQQKFDTYGTRSTSNENYCDKCNLNRSAKIGHCPVCMKCIFNRDHHCFWIDIMS